MAMVDFQRLKELVRMDQVLSLLNWRPSSASGSELRGPCPLHGSRSPRSRSFAAGPGGWTCFKCKEHGDYIRLWALTQGLTMYAAAIDLCRALGVRVPLLRELPRRAGAGTESEERS